MKTPEVTDETKEKIEKVFNEKKKRKNKQRHASGNGNDEKKSSTNKEGFSTYFTPKEHNPQKEELEVPFKDSLNKVFHYLNNDNIQDERLEESEELTIRFKKIFTQASVFEKIYNLTWGDLFAFNTEDIDYKSPEKLFTTKLLAAWQTLFEFLFYCIPTLIAMAIFYLVDMFPAVPETTTEKHHHSHHPEKMEHTHEHEHVFSDWTKFYKDRSSDKRTLILAAYEYLYIWIAIYIAYVLYLRMFGSRPLQPVEKLMKTGNDSLDGLVMILTMFLLALPTLFQFSIDLYRNALIKTEISSYPTLCFFVVFLFSYLFCYLFLNKFGKMFLEIFEYQSNILTYIFIFLGAAIAYAQSWGVLVATNDDTAVEKGKIFSGPIVLVLGLILLIISLSFAPVAQFIFVLYVLYAMIDNPMDLIKYLMSLFGGKSSIQVEAEKLINTSQNNKGDDASFFGKLDYYGHIFIYNFLSLFINVIYFLNKAISFFLDLKLMPVRNVLGSLSMYSFLLSFVMYLSILLYNVPEFMELFIS